MLMALVRSFMVRIDGKSTPAAYIRLKQHMGGCPKRIGTSLNGVRIVPERVPTSDTVFRVDAHLPTIVAVAVVI